MADKHDDYNDDYQFADLDTPDASPFDTPEEKPAETEILAKLENEGRNRVIRNAIIAVVIFILAILVYKFFSAKKPQAQIVTPPKAVAPVQPVVQPQPIAPPIQKPVQPPAVTTRDIQDLEQKINALDNNQQSLRSDLSNLSNQVNTVNTNLSDLSAQITKLSQNLETLSATVVQQSNTIAVLETRLQKPKPVTIKRVIPRDPPPIFYIQAVVPGRAWIISTRGSTLTVREGSSIPGYGVVKLIDAQQGRVLTGSGRVIKFSQEDS